MDIKLTLHCTLEVSISLWLNFAIGKKYISCIWFRNFKKNKKRTSHSIFQLLINVIVIKYVTETLNFVTEGRDVRCTGINIKILGKRKSQTWHVFNFTGTKLREKSQKLRNSRNLMPLRQSSNSVNVNGETFFFLSIVALCVFPISSLGKVL